MRLQIISIKQKQIECSQGNSEVTVPICNRHSSECMGCMRPQELLSLSQLGLNTFNISRSWYCFAHHLLAELIHNAALFISSAIEL